MKYRLVVDMKVGEECYLVDAYGFGKNSRVRWDGKKETALSTETGLRVVEHGTPWSSTYYYLLDLDTGKETLTFPESYIKDKDW